MTWGQLDRAVDDETAKKTADSGSKAFLRGAIAVQEAMTRLDDGEIREAVSKGVEATHHFDEAQRSFENLRDQVERDTSLKTNLENYFRNVSYQEKRQELEVTEETIYLWQDVQIRALRDGAIDIFGFASHRAGIIKESSNRFFTAIDIDSGSYDSMEGSRLLAQVGADLVFGAYVSAVLTNVDA